MSEAIGQPTPPATEEKKIPSFTAVAEERRDARTRELQDLAGVETPAGTETPRGGKAPAEPTFDFDAEWGKLPEGIQRGVVEHIYKGYNDALGKEYGDVIPLLVEAKQNPNLREALKLAATDPELRELLADEDFRRDFKKLSKKDAREFLFGPGYDAFEKYATPADRAAGEPVKDATARRVDELEARYENENNARTQASYISDRQKEMLALRSEFPDLADGAITHVVTLAEQRFETAALRAGIDVSEKNPGWAGQALRRGIKPPSYREGAAELREVQGRATPPVAPATSPATPPGPPQAPRDAAEGKNRALTLLKKGGGFQGVAAAAARRGRG